MYQTIYNIYIGDYHYETCIDEKGLEYVLPQAKEKAKGRLVRIEKEKIPEKEIIRMMKAKEAHNEKIWEEAKKTKNPIEYVERYWKIHEIKEDKELALSIT